MARAMTTFLTVVAMAAMPFMVMLTVTMAFTMPGSVSRSVPRRLVIMSLALIMIMVIVLRTVTVVHQRAEREAGD